MALKNFFCGRVLHATIRRNMTTKLLTFTALYYNSVLIIMLLSESHSHSRQPQSPDPSYLSFDHLHLLSFINTPINSTCSLTLILLSRVHYMDLYQTPYTLICVLLTSLPLQQFSKGYSRSPAFPTILQL